MKKLSKLGQKIGLKKKQPEVPAGRITTDTLAEHRERVLAGGRKFKYPVQYARHRLVINAIIIVAATVVVLVGVGYWLLYHAQNTSDFMYRVTKVVPVPVATVDGQQVRYSEYLMKFRGSVQFLVQKDQVDINTEDGKRQVDFIKNQAMQDSVADAYAMKIAKDKNITVTDAEVELNLKRQLQTSDGTQVTDSSYKAIILDYYGWSPDEYRQVIKTKILRQKVAYAVDQNAEALSTKVSATVASGNTDLNAIATSLNTEKAKSATFWPAAWVRLDNQDGGLATAAAKLEKNQVSKAIQPSSGDGYYYVKLIDKNDTQVRYEYLQIPLSTFNTQLEQAKNDKNISVFITIPSVEGQAQPSKQ